MKLFFLIIYIFIFHGCISTSEEIQIKDKIQTNKEACVKAQSEYLKLRGGRNN